PRVAPVRVRRVRGRSPVVRLVRYAAGILVPAHPLPERLAGRGGAARTPPGGLRAPALGGSGGVEPGRPNSRRCPGLLAAPGPVESALRRAGGSVHPGG